MPTIEVPSLRYSQPSPHTQGQLTRRVAELEVTGAQMEDNALVIQMLHVHDHETVYDVILQCDDLDSGAGLVLDVGDGDVSDRFIDGSTLGQGGGTEQMVPASAAAPSNAEFPRTYDGVDTIDVSVQTAAATGVAGTIRVIALIG